MASTETEILQRALELRVPVLRETDAWRWLDADVDPHGVTIERFGDFAVVNAYTQAAANRRQTWAQALGALGVRGVYYKHRVRDDLRRVSRTDVAPSEPLWGDRAPEPLLVSENGLVFEVRLGDGLSTGLFLDQRDNRARLRRLAAGKRVLNLFCYTGSFSVAAGVGSAEQVTSVDLSGAVLRRAGENLRHNHLAPQQHRLLRADCVAWVNRAVRRGDAFDVVVLDPPSFGSDGSKTWSVERDYSALLCEVARLVEGNGTLLCVTNHRGTSEAAFRAAISDAARAAGRVIARLELPPPPRDCWSVGAGVEGSQGPTKSAMVTFR